MLVSPFPSDAKYNIWQNIPFFQVGTKAVGARFAEDSVRFAEEFLKNNTAEILQENGDAPAAKKLVQWAGEKAVDKIEREWEE